VVSEIALGVMLVIGAALLIRTFNHFMNLKPGFNASNLISRNFRCKTHGTHRQQIYGL